MYIKHWSILLTICEQNREKIDSSIASIVNNIGIKRSAQELHLRLMFIAVTLDKIQRDSCTIADMIEIWKTLQSLTDEEFDNAMQYNFNTTRHDCSRFDKLEGTVITISEVHVWRDCF